jgi:hypothetical protein
LQLLVDISKVGSSWSARATDAKEKDSLKIWLGVHFGKWFPEWVNECSLPFKNTAFASMHMRRGLFFGWGRRETNPIQLGQCVSCGDRPMTRCAPIQSQSSVGCVRGCWGLCFGKQVNRVEDPVAPSILGLDVLLKVWTAGSQSKASGNALRVMVTKSMEMEALEAGMNRTILEGLDQFVTVICGTGIGVAVHLGFPPGGGRGSSFGFPTWGGLW